MAADLTGSKAKDTYSQLLHVSGGVDSTLKPVFDGDGTQTSLKISTSGIEVAVNSLIPALTIRQLGNGNVLSIEDSNNPDTSPIVVDSNGWLGVGISTPEVPFHVKGDVLFQSLNYTFESTDSGIDDGYVSVQGKIKLTDIRATGKFNFTGNEYTVIPSVIGNINNVRIGTTNPQPATFTTLSSTGNTQLGNLVASSINTTPIGNITPSTGRFTTLLGEDTTITSLLVGEITSTGIDNILGITNSGGISNTGTINNTGSIVNSGNITNSGLISSTLGFTGPGVNKTLVFASSGTAVVGTIPTGIYSIEILIAGGGGAGGGTAAVANTAGGGGGGASLVQASIPVVPGQTYTYTIGSGGVPGAAGANPGGNGTSSSITFGTDVPGSVAYSITAGNGNGGTTSLGGTSVASTVTNIPVNSYISVNGQQGGGGSLAALSGGGASIGGDTWLALGVGGKCQNDSNGISGIGFGAGGSGGVTTAATARQGGAGTGGILIIKY